ncbi:XTP/dITP diphosphatase [Lentibacillus amyloliquefaciens]|uniref:dITP/XTP pyrophosphatase n=1 Tax=Lentibacillus amyloliquefaciens TaxID=1472767 RepID=A0A0U4F3R8_9BACI|nr:XTP/dITP diphosphatase [Lentibacillus amyloliquefaciens]ALX48230.1 non-canonical purine NTP pyrophosphatase [Lentibacillus amyloliquefaciens]
MKELVIATKNKGKANEFKSFFEKYGINAISLLELQEEINDIEETGSTFEENAALKAEQISESMQIPVLADDSGLMIDTLDGRPGIFSARYAGEPKDDQANIDKVMHELQESTERSARFVCILAVAVPGEMTIFKKGYCEGKIATVQAGENGFGYDPIFIPVGYTQTMAELSPEEKNKISHRSDAIKKLEDWVIHLQ